MKTFSQFLEEARRMKVLNVYRGDKEKNSSNIKKNRNARSSEYGVYGPGVYASTNPAVARSYVPSSSNRNTSNVGVTRSRIPARNIITTRTPEHNSGEGIQRGRELVYGNPKKSVRIQNAASAQEIARGTVGKKRAKEADYVVVPQDTFNRGITTQPTIRSNRPRRTKTQPKRK